MFSRGKYFVQTLSVLAMLTVSIMSFLAYAETTFSDWEVLSDLNEACSRPAMAAVGNDVYLIGGEMTGGTVLSSVEKYNSVTEEWELLTALKPTAVSNIAAASIGSQIYVPGGYTGSVTLNVLEVFDTDTETWQVIDTDPLPIESSAQGVVAYDGKLYVAGGYLGTAGYADQFLEYDPAAPAGSRWTTLSSLNVERGFFNAVAFNDKIYAIGGRNSVMLDSIEEYDFATDTWTIIDSLPFTDGGGLNAAVLPGPGYLESNYIIIAGGGWTSYRNECYAYNPVTGDFLDYAPLNTGRRTFGMAATPGAFFVAGGWNGQYLASTEKIDCIPLEGEWIETGNLNHAISRPAMAAVGNDVYLIGGEVSGQVRLDTTEKYNMATDEWELLSAEKPTAVSNLAAAAIGTKIYVPGGWTGTVAIDALEVFDTETETWQVIESDPMPTGSMGHGVVAYDGKLYVVGGSVGGVYQNHFMEYDPAAPAGSRWTTLSSLNIERGYFNAVAFNDKIYAIGGRNTTELDSIEEYDFATDTWTTIDSLPFTNSGGVNAAVLQSPGYFESDYIIIAGGGWSSYRNECYAYNPATGLFLEYAPLNTGRRTFGMAATHNALFVGGGWNGAFLSSAEMIFCTQIDDICINNGDVNQDGILSAADAQLAFYIALGLYSPTFEEECAADCNGDGIVTAADAQLIFYSVLGIGNCEDPL
jgi:N-acetylneuraminic acid mutarotase